MARAVWNGVISFGLVTVPVKAFSAVHYHTVHFHQLEKKSGSRISYQKVAKTSGKAVDADDIELGYELAKGNYVTVDPDELAELRPQATRSIDISDFVALAEIDPIYYHHTYWLAPGTDSAARPYRLLLAAMEQEQRVAIGAVVMRNKQYLAAIRPLDGALAMSTMRFADEVVAQADIDELSVTRSKPDAKEMKLATQIIDSLAADWDPKRYHDSYTEELRDLIERKANGEDIVREDTPDGEEGAKVLDLMAALQASIDANRSKKTTGAKKPGAKKPAAKKRAS